MNKKNIELVKLPCYNTGIEIENNIDIWLAKIIDFPQDLFLSKFLPLLDYSEKERMYKFLHIHNQHIFLLAHALKRIALSQYLRLKPEKLVFLTEKNGRPELSGDARASRLRFNLSHTQGLCALVITHEQDVGIDVEEHRLIPNLSGMLESCMSKVEQKEMGAFLTPENCSEQFLIRWTLKEAYAKAVGQGLQLPFNQMTFKFSDFDIESPLVIFGSEINDKAVEWKFYYSRLEKHHLSFAFRSREVVDKKLAPRLFDLKKWCDGNGTSA